MSYLKYMYISGGNALIDAKKALTQTKIGAGMKVADLGCGSSGHFVFPMAEMVGDKGLVYAVDIMQTVLANIDRRAKVDRIRNIKTVWSDLEVFKAAKIPSSGVDLALLANTLYQSKKHQNILREAVRLLKKNGQLEVVEWKSVASPIGPPSSERVKKSVLIEQARKLGLEIIQEFDAGEYHYGVIFEKM